MKAQDWHSFLKYCLAQKSSDLSIFNSIQQTRCWCVPTPLPITDGVWCSWPLSLPVVLKAWHVFLPSPSNQQHEHHLGPQPSDTQVNNAEFFALGFFFLFLFLFCIVGPHLQHVEVPRLGVESEVQLPPYATTTLDLSCVFNLRHSSWQCWILNPLSTKDRTCIVMNAEPRQELPNDSNLNYKTFTYFSL